jgi:hypothetical protein
MMHNAKIKIRFDSYGEYAVEFECEGLTTMQDREALVRHLWDGTKTHSNWDSEEDLWLNLMADHKAPMLDISIQVERGIFVHGTIYDPLDGTAQPDALNLDEAIKVTNTIRCLVQARDQIQAEKVRKSRNIKWYKLIRQRKAA